MTGKPYLTDKGRLATILNRNANLQQETLTFMHFGDLIGKLPIDGWEKTNSTIWSVFQRK